MSRPTPSGIGEEQKNQYRQLIEEATPGWCDLTLEAVSLDGDGLQNFLSRADEFKAVVARAVVYETRALSVGHHQVDDEEVRPLFDHYYSHYAPLGLAEQVSGLRRLFPGLGPANERLADAPLPEGAEGYFAIPRWEAVASTYEAALESLFTLLHSTLEWDVCEPGRVGRFFSYRTGRLGPGYLRENGRSAAMWRRLCDAQRGYDILVVPAQFGLRHAGRSVRRARELMGAGEFGLGAFAVGAMLLNHPGRMVEYDDLWMDCPGDEYSLNGDGRFEAAPLYFFNVGQLEFDVINYERFRSGSVSAFLPE